MKNLRRELRLSSNVKRAITYLENVEFEMNEYQTELITTDYDKEVTDLVDWVETFK